METKTTDYRQSQYGRMPRGDPPASDLSGVLSLRIVIDD
jgi:hypothetical protein